MNAILDFHSETNIKMKLYHQPNKKSWTKFNSDKNSILFKIIILGDCISPFEKIIVIYNPLNPGIESYNYCIIIIYMQAYKIISKQDICLMKKKTCKILEKL